MKRNWIRKPAALASALALVLAISACTSDNDPTDTTGGVTDTTVSDLTTTTAAG